MRVDDRNLNGVAAPQTGRTHEAERPGSKQGPHVSISAGGDTTEISHLAGQVSHALEAHSAQRTARVAKLAKDYQAGRYQADSKSTSRGVIREGLQGNHGA